MRISGLLILGLIGLGCDESPSGPSSVPGPSSVSSSPGLRTIAGTVREVNGGPIAGVRITGFKELQGSTELGMTAEDGSFSVDAISHASFVFRKTGYLGSGLWVGSLRPTEWLNVTVRMQPTLELSPGAKLSGVITADDLTYTGDVLTANVPATCGPCKLISVPALPGTRLRLSWSGTKPLALWTADGYGGLYLDKFNSGKADQSEMTLDVPATSIVDTVLVGVLSGGVTESIEFTLTVERLPS